MYYKNYWHILNSTENLKPQAYTIYDEYFPQFIFGSTSNFTIND